MRIGRDSSLRRHRNTRTIWLPFGTIMPDMKIHMASAAGAKDQYTYDKAVEAIHPELMPPEKSRVQSIVSQIPIPAFR